METSQPPARQIGVGKTVSEAFDLYKQNFGAIIGSALLVFAVVGLLSWLVELGDSWLLGLVAAAIRLIGQALYTGFVVRLVQDVRDGRRDLSIEDLFSAAMPAIGALIVFGLLFGIGVAIGFVLLIVPGLILLTFWAVGAPAIVIEGVGPIEAFGRSWRLVRGQAWSVFGVLLIAFLIAIVVQAVLTAIASAIGDGALLVALILAGAITAPIYSLVSSVLYFDLGGGKPAPTAASAAPPEGGISEPPPPPPPSA